MIIPGVHQPTAPFELVINKDVWQKMPAADQQLVQLIARLVTFESWVKIGNEDAKALEFYRKTGNQIIELDADVQKQARKIGLDWATKTAEKDPAFTKIPKSQVDFEKEWEGAVVRATAAPLNVIAMPGCPDIATLQALGVRRLSQGSGLARAMRGVAGSIARELLDQGRYPSFHRGSVGYAQANALFSDRCPSRSANPHLKALPE